MRKTFTIIEVIIVIAIFSLFTAIAIPNLTRATLVKACVKEGKSEKWCLANVKYLRKLDKEKQQIENEQIEPSDFEKDIKEW